MKKKLHLLYDCTMYDLGVHLREEAQEKRELSQEKQGHVPLQTCMNKVLDDDVFGTFMQLLQSVSKETIAACILQTVGYQSQHSLRNRSLLGPNERPLVQFPNDGPGAYIASIQVEGREGWLDRKELRRLISTLKKYMQAWFSFKAKTCSQQVTDMVYEIDSVNSKKAKRGVTLYINHDQRARKLEQFIRVLTKYYDNTSADAPFIVQCPHGGALRLLPRHSGFVRELHFFCSG